MYVSYTPLLDGPSEVSARGGRIPCKDGEADGRTRTGDPFITRKEIGPDASPPQGTPAPNLEPIRSAPPSGPATLQRPPETGAIYVSYTPTPSEHCLGCGHRLLPTEPGPMCQTCIDAAREATTRRDDRA